MLVGQKFRALVHVFESNNPSKVDEFKWALRNAALRLDAYNWDAELYGMLCKIGELRLPSHLALSHSEFERLTDIFEREAKKTQKPQLTDVEKLVTIIKYFDMFNEDPKIDTQKVKEAFAWCVLNDFRVPGFTLGK